MRPSVVLEIKGRSFVLGRKTWVMGVLNVTPDSFSDGGRYPDAGAAAARAVAMVAEGADIIDVGGESTRPGARPVPPDEELARVVPVIREIRRATPALISVDTTKASVARASLEAGADIVNDVSALRFDPDMAGVAAAAGAAVVLMHMKGTPETMQIEPRYDDLFAEVYGFLESRAAEAETAGIPRRRIIVDPGIGFGKTFAHNCALIDNLSFLEDLGFPVLAGVSRKAFIGKALGTGPEDRLEGSLAAGILCLERGAHILRVHDVRATRRAADLADAVLAGGAAWRPARAKGREHVG